MDKKKKNRDFNSEDSELNFGEIFTTQTRIVLYWRRTAIRVNTFFS